MTPAGGLSGIGTPFNSASRRASTENLASMNTMASSGITATALQNRLNNLDATSSIRPTIENARFPSTRPDPRPVDPPRLVATEDLLEQPLPTTSAPSNQFIVAGETEQGPSGMTSRRASRDGSVHSGIAPQHVEFSQEEMCKVPSYSTALRSRTQTPISEGPPTYQSATRYPMLSNPMPQPPTPAHVH